MSTAQGVTKKALSAQLLTVNTVWHSHGSYNYLVLVTCCVITLAFSLDMFGFSVVVAGSRCDLNLGLTETGVLASAPFTGVMTAFPWGYFADTRGRKLALLISTSGGFFFAALSSISPSWQFMLAVKIIGCCFSSAAMMLTTTLVGECTGTKHRSAYLFIMNSLNLASEFFSFGVALVILPLEFKVSIPWLAITYRPWRLYTFICALPLGIGAVMMLFLHESPKFLANKGEDEKALDVLKKIYQRNGGNIVNYPVKAINMEGQAKKQKVSFCESLLKQTIPIFKPPLLWRTIQLFYLLAICCATNNVFVMWYPTIVNLFFNSFSSQLAYEKTFCEKVFGNVTGEDGYEKSICIDTISTNTIYSGMLYGLFFCVVSLASAKVASYRRTVLITTLVVSGVSGLLTNLKDPIANMIFFTLLQATCVGIASLMSYFVDLYPTSYRGLVTSLGIMAARLISFAGINVTGAVIANNCGATFYFWSAIVFSGVVLSLFLPSDNEANKISSLK